MFKEMINIVCRELCNKSAFHLTFNFENRINYDYTSHSHNNINQLTLALTRTVTT